MNDHATSTMPASLIRAFFTIVMLIPAVWLLLFWSLVFRARLLVGEWPHPRSGDWFSGSEIYANVNPSGFGWHHDLIWRGVPIALYAMIASVVALIAGALWKHVRAPLTARWMFAAVCVIVAIMAFDPGNFAAWFMD